MASRETRVVPCPRHKLTDCPACGRTVEQVPGAWEKFGVVVGKLLGGLLNIIGRIFVDLFEWALFAAVFGSFAWLAGAVAGVPEYPWRWYAGGALVLRVAVLGVRNAWESIDRHNANK